MITVHAIGRLTKDAELRTTNSGKTVTNFTLACKRKRTDKDGNSQATFIQGVLWGKPAQAFVKFTQKGALIGASGELQTRSYDDQQGITHYVTELVVEDFEFLESKATVQQREQKHHEVPPNESLPPIEEAPSTSRPPIDEPSYEQPPMTGMSDYGYNQ